MCVHYIPSDRIAGIFLSTLLIKTLLINVKTAVFPLVCYLIFLIFSLNIVIFCRPININAISCCNKYNFNLKKANSIKRASIQIKVVFEFTNLNFLFKITTYLPTVVLY